jgi:hypothetical protein
MRTCRWCGRSGDWPRICMSTRDMEAKAYDPICDDTLLRLGGGERVENQLRALRTHGQSGASDST